MDSKIEECRNGGIVIRAVIMAGGQGKRLRPLTCDLPKPMVPIINRPVMSYTVNLLRKHGIKDIAVTLAYLPGKIKEYFADGSQYGVDLQYYVEESPLGTAGSVKNTGDFLQGTFIVISGDALTDLDISQALDFHRQRGSKATLVLSRQPIPLEYGVVVTDQAGRITRFLEKPSWGEVFSDTVNTGIYILEPEVMDIPRGKMFDFSKDLFPRLLRENVPMYGYVTDGYWCDIGDLRSYRQAQFDVLKGKVQVEIPGEQVEPGLWVEEGSRGLDNVRWQAPVYIGRGCQFGGQVHLGPNTVLNSHCQVESASLKGTVVWNGSRLAPGVEAREATICSNVKLAARARLFDNSVVGSGSQLEADSTLHPGVKVWPGKTVAPETDIWQNLVWGSGNSRRLFGHRDLQGIFNMEITPEFASRLGSAFASLSSGAQGYVVSADDTAAASLVARSVAAGIQACGQGVIIEPGLVAPMTRFAVGHYKASGGVHVRRNPRQKERLHLEFFNAQGVNIDRNTERMLETAFNAGDHPRASSKDIQFIQASDGIARLYFNWASGGLRALGVGKEGPRIVLGAETEHMAFLGSAFLDYLGCTVARGGAGPESVAAEMDGTSAELGIFLAADGEEITLVGQDGKLVRGENYHALATWLALAEKGSSIVIPNYYPQVLEDMAGTEAQVVAVKSAPAQVMAEMKRRGRDPRVALQYILNFDALQASARILDYLVRNKISLDQVLAQLPQLHFQRRTVPCQWKEKGRVLRKLIGQHSPGEMELYEGVKIVNPRGWTLVLPDDERPQFNIYAQGDNEEFAQELAAEVTDKVRTLLDGPRNKE